MKRAIELIDEPRGLQRLSCGHWTAVMPEMPPSDTAECSACDRFELPDDAQAYKQTPEFTEATLPAGLRREHNTKRGVWGRIIVLDGRLRYRVGLLDFEQELTPDQPPGIIQPEVLHSVEPVDTVRFFVEFLRVP